jgi:hypothetical protein
MEQQINDRINIVLKYYNVTCNELDRELGLSRSATYHIIHGTGEKRSKPSNDFISKFLRRFSEIDANWLILGGNEMFKPDENLLKKLNEEKSELTEKLANTEQQLVNFQFMISLLRQNPSFQSAANFKVVSKKSPVNQQFIIKKTIVVNSLVNSVS